MSKAQKLVNRAKEILLRREQNHLNDQKALAEIRNLVERTEDDGTGRASEQVKMAKIMLQRHADSALTDAGAMDELYGIFDSTDSDKKLASAQTKRP
jgi:hypothetical protein